MTKKKISKNRKITKNDHSFYLFCILHTCNFKILFRSGGVINKVRLGLVEISRPKESIEGMTTTTGRKS